MRVYNWPELLSAFIRDRRSKQFSWGEHDCCLTACDWIKTSTGIDPAEEFRETYHDARGALRVIAEYGGLEQLAVAIGQKYGFEEVPVNFAQTGDIVLVRDASLDTNMGNGHPTLGIMGSDGQPLVPAETGITAVPRRSALRAWRI